MNFILPPSRNLRSLLAPISFVALSLLAPTSGSAQSIQPSSDSPRSAVVATAVSPAVSVRPLTVTDGIWDPTTEPTVVDILMLFTPAAAAAHGNEEALTSRLQQQVSRVNQIFTNSLVGIRLNPVFIGRIDPWTETGNPQTEIAAMPTNALVTALRSDFKADLVYLVTEVPTSGVIGSATMISRTDGNSRRAYCALLRSTLVGTPRGLGTDDIILAQLTGHLFGSGNDLEHGLGTPFQGLAPAYPYGNGYRFEAAGTAYRTVMSHGSGIQLPFFSNPNLAIAGVPLGIPAGMPGASDNAQALNRMGPVVAGYFKALSRIEFAQPRIFAGEGDGVLRLTLHRTGDLSSATQVQLVIDPASTVSALDHSLSPTTLVTFDADQATAEVAIPLLPNTEVEGDQVLQLSLSGVQGDHGLGRISRCTITIQDDELPFALSSPLASVRESGGEVEVSVDFTGPLASSAQQDVALVVGEPEDTATADDFEVSPTRLTFSADQRRQTFRLRAKADTLPETDEIVHVGIGNARWTARILDDDRTATPLPVAAPNGSITALKVLPDGGVLAAGNFTRVDGIRRTGVVRLNADGRLDPSFTPPELLIASGREFTAPPAKINCLLPVAGGRLLLGGLIALADSRTVHHLVRVEANGRLDTSFQPPPLDGPVWTLTEQPDGKILVGGSFDYVGTQNVRGLIRLNADGSLDSEFQTTVGFGGFLVIGAAIGVLPDGKILVGGSLEQFGGRPIQSLIRLNADGTLDASFPSLDTGVSGMVQSIAVLPDGRAYLAGRFESVGGQPHRHLARLQADGSVDPTFRSPEANAEIYHVQPLPNGQLVVGGMFTRIGGSDRRFLALLNEDGTLDPNFDAGRGAGDQIWNVAATPDGSLYVGGLLQEFNEQSAPFLARLRLPPLHGSLVSPRHQDGEFSGQVQGLPGMSYPLESSVDLLHWQPAGEVKVEHLDQAVPFTLPTAGPSQFLRLKP